MPLRPPVRPAAPARRRTRSRWTRRAVAAAIILTAPIAWADVVIESVADDAPEDQRALQPGDVVRGWRPAGATSASGGTLSTPFDWWWLQLERVPLGPVVLEVHRDGVSRELTLAAGRRGPGLWSVAVRPELPRHAERRYSEGRDLIRRDDVDGGLAAWRTVADGRASRRDPLLRAWLLQRRGDALLAAGRVDEALADHEMAVREADAAGSAAARAETRAELGRACFRAGRYDRALDVHRAAARQLATTHPGSLPHAAAVHDLGTMTLVLGDLAAAAELLEEAAAVRRRAAPDSLALAETLNNLGLAATYLGDFERGEAAHLEALEIRRERVPDSLDLAASYNNLGLVAKERGRLDEAERYYLQDLELSERLAPGSEGVATTLMNLGAVAWERGDLALAERRFRSSLAILEEIAPDGIDVAANLNNLALVAEQRGDLAAADTDLRRALGIWRARTPDSQDVASGLLNLGLIAWRRRDLDAAETLLTESRRLLDRIAPDGHVSGLVLVMLGDVAIDRGELDSAERSYRESLELRRRIMPDNPEIAANLINLAAVARRRGRADDARALLLEAIDLRRASSPASLFVAHGLHALGELELDAGDLDAAESSLEEALEIRSRLAPGSTDEASTLYVLGRTSRVRGHLEDAADQLSRAIASLEEQVGKLGGSEEARAGFRAHFGDLYRELIEVQLEMGRPGEAFSTLERSRAQLFLATLAERDLVLEDVPEPLERRRRELAAASDRALAELAELGPTGDADAVSAVRARLDELRRERAVLAAEVRASSPRLASLRYPETLDAAEARARLAEGTVVLAYSIGTESSDLFVVDGGEGLAVHRLPAGAGQLRRAVADLRGAIVAGGTDGFAPSAHVPAGAALYDLLVRPAEAAIGRSERIVVVPDGPLHALPYAALVTSGGGPRPRYLVEHRPLSVVLSTTVLDELARGAGPTDGGRERWRVAGFGDPAYPGAASGGDLRAAADPVLRSVAARGFELEPLPATRDEVSSLARLWPDTADVFVGPTATEDAARAASPRATVLHFACHGLLDEDFPLESALALTIPAEPRAGAGNGLLQAWEIFEGLRVDARLVTLSACQTALGAELGGEGLVGLSRAFQYAGARTVVASLWSVSDRSTARLMEAFYRELRDGAGTAEALRTAQLELLGPADAAPTPSGHPFFWAAFQVIGDWR